MIPLPQHLELLLWAIECGVISEPISQVQESKSHTFINRIISDAIGPNASKVNYPPTSLLHLFNELHNVGFSSSKAVSEIENFSTRACSRHSIIYYYLNDLVPWKSSSRLPSKERVLQDFVQTFAFPSAHKKLVEALWYLDHNQPGALPLLNNPSVLPLITGDLPVYIVKAFLDSNNHHKALQFLRSCPVIAFLSNIEATLIYLQVLLSNKLIVEAFEFQQLCQSRAKSDAEVKEILYTFYSECFKGKIFILLILYEN